MRRIGEWFLVLCSRYSRPHPASLRRDGRWVDASTCLLMDKNRQANRRQTDQKMEAATEISFVSPSHVVPDGSFICGNIQRDTPRPVGYQYQWRGYKARDQDGPQSTRRSVRHQPHPHASHFRGTGKWEASFKNKSLCSRMLWEREWTLLLSEASFCALLQVTRLLERAARNRAVAATQCNERSSRSHSVFRLKLTGKNAKTGEACDGKHMILLPLTLILRNLPRFAIWLLAHEELGCFQASYSMSW